MIIALLHLAGTGTGVSILGCPFHSITGIPCPGCGLTTAMLQFCRGEWHDGFSSHAFAPLFLGMLLGSAVLGTVSSDRRHRVLAALQRSDARFGLSYVLVAAFLVYWLIRVSRGL